MMLSWRTRMNTPPTSRPPTVAVARPRAEAKKGPTPPAGAGAGAAVSGSAVCRWRPRRSEERRVGKEHRAGVMPKPYKRKHRANMYAYVRLVKEHIQAYLDSA